MHINGRINIINNENNLMFSIFKLALDHQESAFPTVMISEMFLIFKN